MNNYHQFTYTFYIACCLYVISLLPYGRFYNRLGGNVGLLGAYMYIFIYLGFTVLRRPLILDITMYNLYNKSSNFKKLQYA